MSDKIAVICVKTAQAKQLAADIQQLYGADLAYGTGDELRSGVFRQVSVVISTWDMVYLSKAEISQFLPNLERVLYCAGDSSYFETPYAELGITVTNSIKVNSEAVANYTLGVILLCAKGYFYASRNYGWLGVFRWRSLRRTLDLWPANSNTVIGILGYGNVGQALAAKLSNHDVKVIVFDARRIGDQIHNVEQSFDINDVFENCDVIVNCLPDVESTRSIITYDQLKLMGKFASFINVGRGRQVSCFGLVFSLLNFWTRTAVLDVLSTEPIRPWSVFHLMPNVVVTPHMAGSSGNEVKKMIKSQCDDIFCAPRAEKN